MYVLKKAYKTTLLDVEIGEKIQISSLNIKYFSLSSLIFYLITHSNHLNNNKHKNKVSKRYTKNLGPKFSSTFSTTQNSNLRQEATIFRTHVFVYKKKNKIFEKIFL